MVRFAINIEEEMKTSYLDYAMSVIVGRALPDVRDGLKPVQRRILYAMLREGLTPGKKYSKCAGVVGEVLKKYHPHGDSAVYDALVRLAQDFNMRYPLVDGQGNFGSIDGDPAAAYRYTEARLAKIAEEMLVDIDKETVDFIPNFDETTAEPTVLPARIPNLLVNGSSGIAVGMATNIPPHNLGELVDGLLLLLERPDATVKEIMKKINGPDFPTGSIIHGRKGIVDAYSTGRGHVKMRARVDIEEHKKGSQIIISELPYQVNKARLIEKIAELVRQKKIEGISDLRDESDREGIRVVLDVKRGEIPQVILNNLYKHTPMESTFGIIMLAIVNGQPRVLNLLELLSLFIKHRREVTVRKTRFELRKAEEKAHLLEGLKIALDNLDRIIKLIRQSKTPEEALSGLMKGFPLSKVQAQAILDMRLQRLTGLEREKIIQDYKDTLKEIKRLKAILDSPALVDDIIRQELEDVKKKYADKRRTEITREADEITMEDLVADEDVVITITHQGYIKRTSLDEYRSQRRGGKGIKGMATRKEDFIEDLFIASCHDFLLFFTNFGRLYWLKVYQVPELGRAARGKAIVSLIQMSSRERITAVFPVKEFSEGQFLFMATRKGYVKKTSLIAYSKPRASGINAIKIEDNDELIGVRATNGEKDIILSTRDGMSIRFNEKNVREMGRTARGVRGINLKPGDEVVSVGVVEKDSSLLTVTEKGFGKKTRAEEYRVQSRGGKGIKTIKITEKNGRVLGVLQVTRDDEIILISEKGQIIRMKASDLRMIGRATQGVRLMKLDEDDKVVSFARVAERETEEGETGELFV
jgi:DNA gyrase subunit A